MWANQIVCCIVFLFLGILLFYMLKGVCDCKVVEGLHPDLPCSTHEDCINYIITNADQVSGDKKKKEIKELIKPKHKQQLINAINKRTSLGESSNKEKGMSNVVEGFWTQALIMGSEFALGVGLGELDTCSKSDVCGHLPGTPSRGCHDIFFLSTCLACDDNSTCCQANKGCR